MYRYSWVTGYGMHKIVFMHIFTSLLPSMEMKLVEAFLFLANPAVDFGDEMMFGSDDTEEFVDIDSIERLEFGFAPMRLLLFRCISGFCGFTRMTLCRDSMDGTELVFALVCFKDMCCGC